MKKYIDRLSWGTDASFYRLIPKEVLMPANEQEVQQIILRAAKEGRHITFRAAGTSLSGQTQSDDLLVVCGKKWEDFRTFTRDGELFIDAQPGIIGQRINDILKKDGHYFTPDPASIKSAMLGGIVMNNASGMCCGIHANSHRMLDSVRIILADGTILDTGDEQSVASFRVTHSPFLNKIESIRNRINRDAKLKERILQKYSIKNVTGLNLLPFVDFERPFDILAHLLVGSEGTLAFLSRVRMKTARIEPYSASALLLYPTTKQACEQIIKMKKTGALSAAEFFDRKAMQTVEHDFPELQGQPADAGAVLIRIDAKTPEELEEKKKTLQIKTFTSDPALVSKYWAMRSGIFPAVGGTRPVGTTCLIEDIAFPIEFLAEATLDLQKLFKEHNYPDAVIYGHALEGNYHFILNQRFETPQDVEQYDKMMHAVVDLVVDKYGGSLKAEHGTGRNMAPFVEREWGTELYDIMKEVKQLFDPTNMFNPGVIFTDDEKSYIQHIKPLPAVHPLIDKCIECGFCEVSCVSCGYAMSSRQRIVVQREIVSLKQQGNAALATDLERDFRTIGKDLCAGDGLCSMSCPVKINTGDYIHLVREREMTPRGRQIGVWAAENFGTVGNAVKNVLGFANAAHTLFGDSIMTLLGKGLYYGSGKNIPLWTTALPKPVSKKDIVRAKEYTITHPLRDMQAKKVVYFPSCLNQRLGVTPAKHKKCQPLINDMTELLNKANYEVIFLENMQDYCCGTIWESKGMPEIADKKAAELEKALWHASEEGKWPVLCDQSPCLYRMRHTMHKMHLYEPAEFIEKFLLERLDIQPVAQTIALHITCSMRKMGLADTIIRVAKRCANNVVVPEEIGCCAFAGDKGFTNPELNAWALRKLKKQIKDNAVSEGYSNSRTCEIGLTLHSTVPYYGIAKLVNDAARQRK